MMHHFLENADEMISASISGIHSFFEKESTTFYTVFLIFVIMVVYYYFMKAQPLRLHYHKNSQNELIVSNTPQLKKRRYYPTLFLLSGHLQTFGYAFISTWNTEKEQVNYQRDIVKLSDGGQIAVDWAIYESVEEGFCDETPIVLISPGLTGDRTCLYVYSIIKECKKYGFKSALVNHRGGSQTPLTSPKLYCGASIEDFEGAVELAHRKFPKNPIYAVGLSLGANIGINYLGIRKEKALLKGFVSICNPYDFFILDQELKNTLFGIYRKGMGYLMSKKLQEHKEALRCIEKDLGYTIEEGLQQVKNNKDFDTFFTSKIFNYGTAYHYYRKASCIHNLMDVKIPCLLLNYLDDPIVNKSVIPYDEILKNPNLILATHPVGGHLAHFGGLSPKQWHQIPVVAFIHTIQKLSEK